ncbi:MAG TPA: M48 family peptidase [Gammaproteobacteria bacterium]|nr:M48 family peptidase [Gammaproteobacteria bacterium]
MNTYKDIEYSLATSERKTASIYIERDGKVSVLAPANWSQDKIEQVLERKRGWIYRGLAEWEDLNAKRVSREFVSGEGFLYLGRTYRLRIVEEQAEPLMLRGGYFCLRSDLVPQAQETFKAFYRKKAYSKILDRVEYYRTKMGITYGNIRVMELQNRWASCSNGGDLNFHWKCMMAPLNMIDYIVVHELAHVKHANHSDAFWGEVDKIMPDYKVRKAWLRENGAGMDV